MGAPQVLLVGETPSLGRSLADYLESVEIPTQLVKVTELAALESLARPFGVIIAASHGYFCGTARRWLRGELPWTTLVVVGSRDPLVLASPDIRRFDLPLQSHDFAESIRELVAHRPRGAEPRPTSLGLGPRRRAPPGVVHRQTRPQVPPTGTTAAPGTEPLEPGSSEPG